MRRFSECKTLGDMLVKERYDAIAPKISEEYFTECRKDIYRAIVEMWNQNIPPTRILLAEKLGDISELSFINSGNSQFMERLDDLTNECNEVTKEVTSPDNTSKPKSVTQENISNNLSIYKKENNAYVDSGVRLATPCKVETEPCKVEIENLTRNEEQKKTLPGTYTDLTRLNRDSSGRFATVSGSVAGRLNLWLPTTQGWFERRTIYRECNILPSEKDAFYKHISDLIRDNKLEKDPNREGWFRYRSLLEPPDMEFGGAETPLDIDLMFDLSKWVDVFSTNIIVVAGASGAGKSAVMYDFIFRNYKKHTIYYWQSESSSQNLAKRWKAVVGGNGDWRGYFHAKDIMDACDASIMLHPEDIHIFDYIQLTEDYHLIGGIIKNIENALKGHKGIAVIALQKAEDARLAVGGQFTKHKSALYLSLDNSQEGRYSRMKIEKVRNSKTSKNVLYWALDYNIPTPKGYPITIIKALAPSNRFGNLFPSKQKPVELKPIELEITEQSVMNEVHEKDLALNGR